MEQQKELMLSVIVPVYNVERYLAECLESILKQKLDSMEIILIDDGSTDSSGQICNQYAAKDKRIQVIHQLNAGVSAARNAGLERAKGKYIAFVDSDDFLPENVYKYLLEGIDNQQLVMGGNQLMSEDGELSTSCIPPNKTISKEKFLEDLFEEKRFPYLGFLWDKLFFRKIITENNIKFDEEVKLNEDRLFVLKYILCCNNVKFFDKVVYYYRQRSSGVIVDTRRNESVTDSEMTVLDSFAKMKIVCQKYSDKLYYVCSRKAFESALDLLNRVSKKDKDKVNILKKFLWENSRICLNNPQYSILDKIKIIGHSLLQK